MTFDSFFQTIELPILICPRDGSFSACYGNPAATHLLALQEDLCGQGLQKLLRLPHSDYARLQRNILTGLPLPPMKTKLCWELGEAQPLRLWGNRINCEGASYYKLCLDPQQIPRVQGELLLRVTHLAHRATSIPQAILGILALVGRELNLRRLTVYEQKGHCLTLSYPWSIFGEEIHSTEPTTLVALFNEIMCTELFPPNTCAGTGEFRVAASQETQLVALPLLWREAFLGYLIGEAPGRDTPFPQEHLWLMEEVALLISSFIQRREEDSRRQYHLDVLNTVTRHVDGMLYVQDSLTKDILFANRALSEALSLPLSALQSKGSRAFLQELYQNCKEAPPLCDGTQRWEFFHPKTQTWYLAHRSHIRWIDGRQAHLTRMTDITDRKAHETALEEIASLDRLTGVYNREWGCRILETFFQKEAFLGPACLVFIDLDRLKYVNDQFGHSQGDRMIQDTIALIQETIRKSDIICRWGGDEFVLLLRTGEADSRRIMENILSRLQEYNATACPPAPLSFSYGLAEISPGSEQCLEKLIAEADQKMYDNKLSRSQRDNDK